MAGSVVTRRHGARRGARPERGRGWGRGRAGAPGTSGRPPLGKGRPRAQHPLHARSTHTRIYIIYIYIFIYKEGPGSSKTAQHLLAAVPAASPGSGMAAGP